MYTHVHVLVFIIFICMYVRVIVLCLGLLNLFFVFTCGACRLLNGTHSLFCRRFRNLFFAEKQ